MGDMTPEERAAKKKRDKARQKANKNKPTDFPAGVVGSGISGTTKSGTKSGAKVKASKESLPQMNRHERFLAAGPQFSNLQGPLGDPNS